MIKKMNLEKKIELVDRGTGAEIFSSIVNGFGAIFALVAMIVIIVVASKTDRLDTLMCSVFYGISFFITYLFSCLYHALAYNNGKRALRALTISSVSLLFLSMITTYNVLIFGVCKKMEVFVITSLVITLLTFIANIWNFEKFKYVRILGFLILTAIALATAYFSLGSVTIVGAAFMLVSAILYGLAFALHIFGYQIGYFNSIGHMLALTANVFMFFTTLLYVI